MNSKNIHNTSTKTAMSIVNGDLSHARDIETITNDILLYKNQAGEAVYEIGRCLIEAKEQLGHGFWLKWLDTSVDISERMAQRYIMLVQKYSNPTALTDLGFSKALTLLLLAEPEREDFMEKTHVVNGVEKSVWEMSTRELERTIRQSKDNAKIANDGNEESPKTKPDNLIAPIYDFAKNFKYVENRIDEILEYIVDVENYIVNVDLKDKIQYDLDEHYSVLSELCNKILISIDPAYCIYMCLNCVSEYLENNDIDWQSSHYRLTELRDKLLQYVPLEEPKSEKLKIPVEPEVSA